MISEELQRKVEKQKVKKWTKAWAWHPHDNYKGEGKEKNLLRRSCDEWRSKDEEGSHIAVGWWGGKVDNLV